MIFMQFMKVDDVHAVHESGFLARPSLLSWYKN